MNTAEKALVYRDSQFHWQLTAQEYIDAATNVASLAHCPVDALALPLTAIGINGEADMASLAKVLVTTAFQTRANKIFRDNMSGYVDKALEGYKSPIDNMTICFIDQVDRMEKDVLLLADPGVVAEDPAEMLKVLDTAANEAGEEIQIAVGFFQGISRLYPEAVKEIQRKYPVYDGADFWNRFTGDDHFYQKLTSSFVNTIAFRTTQLLQQAVEKVTEELQTISL